MPRRTTSSLLSDTHRLLQQDPRTPSELARASGLSYHWLMKMKARAIRDPSVNRVEQLHNFLTDSKPVAD